MRRWFVAVVTTLALALPAGAALAQDAEGGVVDPETGVVYQKKTVYDFEDDVVEGTLVKPEGDYLQSRQRGKHSSLIKIRDNFVPEMLKSAEDL
jgi:hypothetical protein